MQSLHNNIYKTARKNAGLTQMQAAELLNVSVRSLADYETGKTIPPDDVVIAMIEVYKAQWLAYSHLQKSTLIGKRYLPEIDLSDLPKAVLRLKKEIADLEKLDSEIINIACDGKIDKHEKMAWGRIVKEIREAISAAYSVIFSKEGA
ncbi:helix-turn-helix domain protein [Caldicellulosiruptor hydrothermalis 108]|uniref:Helix-turn-helix domain protein n=1 Tax=Caldicellulosiruptor hydrothermalis (strain DSM 18901 / VKM B-2411 / 108) TaxID=632292 RepID=E4QDR3_CALH1|nr:transcriptional regulator [Caldicellulosiruptor hydrothermalis]ADQ06480.1 helix-turn-helix domain protein [Caldicellulosiruptor hydrothermalis 108]